MSLLLDIFSIVAICAGAFFFLAGTAGLLRFPDALTRLHALTKADNLGLGLVVLGLLPRADGVFAGAQADRGLVARAAGERGRLAAHRARRAARRPAAMSWTVRARRRPGRRWSWVWRSGRCSVRQTFAAVVAFVVYGLTLTLVWVRLSAPDVALTEAAIGSGLTGVLLLGRGGAAACDRSGVGRRTPGCGCALRRCGARSAAWPPALAVAVLYLPEPAHTLAPHAVAELPATGMGNAVTGVLMAYRAADTLLEKVVVLIALIGVWSLAEDKLWGGRPGTPPSCRPGRRARLPGAAACRRSGIVAGVYIAWVGADQPGGAFPGGTIIAAMWLLTMMAGVTDTPPISGRALRLVLVAGPAVFLAVGFSGFFIAGAFLAYPVAYAKPLIVIVEVGMVLTDRRHAWTC